MNTNEEVTRQPGQATEETNVNEEVTRQPGATTEETSTNEEGTDDGYLMTTQLVSNQLTGDNIEQAEASLQLSGSTVQMGKEPETTAVPAEPGNPDDNGATAQPFEDLGTTEDINDVVVEDGSTAGTAGLEEELTVAGQSDTGEEG